MEILDIYKSLLSNAGMTANEQGFISMSLAGMEEQPVLIKGKRLVMPTEKQLSNGDFSKRVVFQPLSESISRGESEVVTSFREHLNARINFITGYVSICLLTLATNVQKHKELNPEQLEMLLKIKDADEGTLERFQKITERMIDRKSVV